MSPHRLLRLSTTTGLLSLAVLLPPSAMAQAATASSGVWRCGDGRYSSVPCPGGTALDAADPRTDEQREQSRAAVAADKRQADQLAAERRARDGANNRPQAVNLSASSKPAPMAEAASATKGKTRSKAKTGTAKSDKSTPPKKARTPRA